MKKTLSFIISMFLICTAFLPGMAFAQENEETTANIRVESVEKENCDTNRIFLEVGKSKALKVKINPENATNKELNWQSSAPDIISVSSKGKITAVKAGFATITSTAKDNSKIKLKYKVFGVERNSGNLLSTENMNIVSTSKSKYTYEQLEKDLQKLNKAYPDLMSYSSVGTTYDNRSIYEVVVGNPKAPRHILIQACMHAREYLNAVLVMRQIESICAEYYTGAYKGKAFCELLENTCIHFIPMLNPDGVSISQFGLDGIRNKKLKENVKKMCDKYGNGKKSYYTRWKANARGVDLNKNYPLNWSKNKTGLGKPRSEGYKGAEAGSEKETKVLMSRVTEINPKLVISYHSTGSVIYWNFFQKGKLQSDCKSLFKLANGLTNYGDAEPGIKGDYSDLQPNFGSWVCGKQGIPTLTIETGVNQCPLKKEEFDSIWKKHKFLPEALSYWAICHNETEITELCSISKGFRLNWKKKTYHVTGYQIKYSKSKNFSDEIEYITIDDNTRISQKITDLKSGDKYYSKIRTYRIVDGIKFYGNWSDKKSIIIK